MLPRNTDSAYFSDEQNGTRATEGRGFLNKFKISRSFTGPEFSLIPRLDIRRLDVRLGGRNYLDPDCVIDETRPELRVKLRQPQKQIPVKNRNTLGNYNVYIGSKTWSNMIKAKAEGRSPPELKIVLLFGIGNDVDNLGLRYYFEQVDDKVLINIPGIENEPRWGIGITGLRDMDRNIVRDQINYLMNYTLDNTELKAVRYKITTLAAYSAGYVGLNQTVNEELIPLHDIESVVYYDCIYRADKPEPGEGEPNPPNSLTKYEKMFINRVDSLGDNNAGSAYNTRRALSRISKAAGNDVKMVAYMATPKGSPTYPSNKIHNDQFTVDFPIKIDLTSKECQDSLFAIALTRCLKYAQLDGQLNSTDIPLAFKALEWNLPPRGKVASTRSIEPKPGFSPETNLLDYGKFYKEQTKKNPIDTDQISKAIHLISTHELIYQKGERAKFSYPSPGNHMGLLHFALIPEFAWEYLI